jgi:hypothetical protein
MARLLDVAWLVEARIGKKANTGESIGKVNVSEV